MIIERQINGKRYDIELSEEELYEAYKKKHDEINMDKIFQYLDYCETVGEIPSELLKSERFADKAISQLNLLESNYEENIITAVQMAVDYEIRSETIEDTVCASTADIIIKRLENANLQLDTDSANLQHMLKTRPGDVIHSLKEAPAAGLASASQRNAVRSCVDIVSKYRACAYIGRSINELGDHDDLEPEKGKDNPQSVEQQQKRSRSR